MREAAQGELDAVHDVLVAAYGQYAAALPADLFDLYFANVTDVGELGDGGRAILLVAESAGRIAGTARLYPPGTVDEVDIPAGWAWVRAVAVHPELRRAGLAQQLMAECKRRAAAGGATVLCLHTMAFMPDAVRLYERLGYRRAPELDIDVAAENEIDGDMVALAYRLDLAS